MRLHHLNIVTKDIVTAKRKLSFLYGFRDYGFIQNSKKDLILVLRQNNIFLTITEKPDVCVETIDDIAFCVDSVHQCCEDVVAYGGTVLESCHLINCENKNNSTFKSDKQQCACQTIQCGNYVKKAVIKSSVGNVRHSIYDKSNFCGDFLPGFVRTSAEATYASQAGFDNIDHIALAVPCNEATRHIDWYKYCMKFLRFKTSSQESSSGVVIRAKHGNGVRLLTLVEHPCSNMAISESSDKEVEVRNGQFKFVFCESLLDEGSDQIQTFLRQHGGAGVQHVAFHTKKILSDAQSWIDRGVNFIKPPPAYYKEISSTLDKLKSKYDIVHLRNNGILIDAEKLIGDTSEKEGYLYQVFTEPVFDSKTFFFEVIQREQARGFGEGNVSALWRAVDAHVKSNELEGDESEEKNLDL